MSPECRKILSADNLLQAFSAAYVTTGLERARREALVRADGGFDLLMQLYVFPRVHDFEARCADFLAAKEELHKAELALVVLTNELFEFRKAVVMRDPAIAGGSTLPKDIRAAECEVEKRVSAGRAALRASTHAFDVAKSRVHTAYRNILTQPLTGEAMAASEGPAIAPRLFRCSAEACGGNYRSSDGICMVCQLRHCKRCAIALAEPVEGEPAHQCNPDDVASLKEIATSTRECPRCHTSIMRSSGCDQMMCTNCHCIFDWRTGAEARGVIHNPHFHQLGVEERQRIMDEREARGIASNREERFLAGAGPRRVVPPCDPDAEIDPECEPFESRSFQTAIQSVFGARAPLDQEQVNELYRLVLHHENAETPRLERLLASDALSEQGARLARLERMRGAPLELPQRIKGGHPQKFASQCWVIPPKRGPPSESNYKALLMRIDTERTKVSAQLQVSQTFADNGKALLRLLLAATPSERPGVLGGLQRLADETKRLGVELQKKPAKRKTVRVLPPPKRSVKRAREREPTFSEDDDEDDEGEEESSEDSDDDAEEAEAGGGDDDE